MEIELTTAIVLILNFFLSLWNGYTGGYTIGILKKQGGSTLGKIGAYSIVGLAFAGMAYVMSIVVMYFASTQGYASPEVISYVLGFNFIVFGFLGIGFGLIVTIRSIVIAAKNRDLMSMGFAVWNTIVGIMNIATYINGFENAKNAMNISSDRNRQDAYKYIIIAVLIAFFFTYGVYKYGLSKAQTE